MNPAVPGETGIATASAALALNGRDLRDDFPALRQTMHGKPLVYLDSAATTQKPEVVLRAVREFYEHSNANIHRGVYDLSVRATRRFEQARLTAQRFIGAPRHDEIIFVRGATEGINLVAYSYGQAHVAAGDEIVVSALEHHSNIVPWQLLCERSGARLRVAPINDSGEIIQEAYQALLNSRTRVVALAQVSNALGTINPIPEMCAAAHACGAVVLVDGAQSVPHLPVDVRDLDCDFFVLSAHKMYGPTGAGVLWGRRELLEGMPPYQGGGDMIKSVSFEKTLYNDLPFRFEAGTPNLAGVVGMAAAMDYLSAVGLQRVAEYEADLLGHAIRRLAEIPEVRLIGTAEHKAAVVSFVIDGVHAHDVGTILDSEGIAVRTGHHCAQPVMERFGVPATARASLSFTNTRGEIDQLADVLRTVVKVLG